MQEIRPSPTKGKRGSGASVMVRRAAQLIDKGRPEEALCLAREVLERFPANRKARDLVSRIEATPPRVPLGRDPEEQARLEKLMSAFNAGDDGAVIADAPALIDAFPTSAMLHAMLGRSLLNRDRAREAVKPLRRCLELRPDHHPVRFTLGEAHVRLYQRSEALAVFGALIDRSGLASEAWNQIGSALLRFGDRHAARAAFTRAIEIDPSNHLAVGNRGAVHVALGLAAEAIADFEVALELTPEEIGPYINIAVSLRSLGRDAEALAVAKAGLSIDPVHPQLLSLLSKTVPRAEMADWLDPLDRALEAAGPGTEDEAKLRFARFHLLDKLERTDAAMAELRRSGEAAQSARKYDFAGEEIISKLVGADFATPPEPLRLTDPDLPPACFTPIFVVGMPRSGTTLTEALLAAHSEVHGAGELEALRSACNAAGWARRAVDRQMMLDIRTHYFEQADRQRPESSRWLVDKMPVNFRFIGYIAAAFPEARIVYTHRSPEAVCWSNLSIFFPSLGMTYSMNQRTVARFYRLHEAYMRFWRARYGARIHEVGYEQLTEAPETEARRLFEAVGLAWEDTVLDTEKRNKVVLTASSAQVRQDIYTGSSEKWRKYEPWLGEMLETLGTAHYDLG